MSYSQDQESYKELLKKTAQVNRINFEEKTANKNDKDSFGKTVFIFVTLSVIFTLLFFSVIKHQEEQQRSVQEFRSNYSIGMGTSVIAPQPQVEIKPKIEPVNIVYEAPKDIPDRKTLEAQKTALIEEMKLLGPSVIALSGSYQQAVKNNMSAEAIQKLKELHETEVEKFSAIQVKLEKVNNFLTKHTLEEEIEARNQEIIQAEIKATTNIKDVDHGLEYSIQRLKDDEKNLKESVAYLTARNNELIALHVKLLGDTVKQEAQLKAVSSDLNNIIQTSISLKQANENKTTQVIQIPQIVQVPQIPSIPSTTDSISKIKNAFNPPEVTPSETWSKMH